MGADRADFAGGGEPLAGEQIAVDGGAVEVQGDAVGVAQLRPGQCELALNVGADRADFAGGGEPLVGDQVADEGGASEVESGGGVGASFLFF